jgi:hypothetical protein
MLKPAVAVRIEKRAQISEGFRVEIQKWTHLTTAVGGWDGVPIRELGTR